MKKCIIAGGGDPCLIPHKDALYIAADRGLVLLRGNGIEPDLVIGDFDSTSYPQDVSPERIVKLPVEKDDTDTMFAVKKALSMGCDDIELYGCTGGRLSHTIANIQTLRYIREHGASGRIISDDSVVMLISSGETRTFPQHSESDILSVFAQDRAQVEIHGCLYSGRYELDCTFPLGVSNRITDKEAVIHSESGELLVIHEFHDTSDLLHKC